MRLLSFLLIGAALLPARPLLVISIDGLDHRYLRDADKLGLKIPNLRKLVKDGSWADGGVVGVVPTVTFPSHTSIITGVRPDQHGILNNNRPKEDGGRAVFLRQLPQGAYAVGRGQEGRDESGWRALARDGGFEELRLGFS